MSIRPPLPVRIISKSEIKLSLVFVEGGSDWYHLFMLDLRIILLGGMFGFCLLLEKFRPLRKVTQKKTLRVLVNLAIAGVGALVLRFIFFPLVLSVSQWGETNQIGFSYHVGLTRTISFILVLLFLDYSLYIWHWLNHKVPFLWRFHNVHHVDLDLDVSTASRFHFGELIISTAFRSGQILLFGVTPQVLIIYELLITLSAQFHHSNFRLPFAVEKQLNKLIVTPRMHGIHHSIVRKETDSNFSTIFSFWDRIHSSFNFRVPQEEITIGVASYRDPEEITFLKSLLLPFQKQRPWRLPDGKVPERN